MVETLRFLIELAPDGIVELLVIDQTEVHELATDVALEAMHAHGQIRWIKLSEPSIPAAMNRGLVEAKSELVLFVDDDIKPTGTLISAHMKAHAEKQDVLVAGRVIQPWQEGGDFSTDTAFHFASTIGRPVDEFIGCNFSVRKASALAVGGFDENFVKVAYRYEAEFAYRFRRSGRSIWFEPTACLHHLKDASGGTRTYGEHLTTWRPDHAVGAYYFALRTGALRELFTRPFLSVMTRFHLRRPWRIAGTLWAEVRGLLWALRLRARGPRYVTPTESRQL